MVCDNEGVCCRPDAAKIRYIIINVLACCKVKAASFMNAPPFPSISSSRGFTYLKERSQ